MIAEIQSNRTAFKVREKGEIVLEFAEAECEKNRVRVIIQEVGLVGLEKQIKQVVEALGLDREQLLKSVELKYLELT